MAIEVIYTRFPVVAAYPRPQLSAAYARQCLRLIQEKGLGGDVEISTGFLPHEETLRELANSDLVVLPYLHSTESSSAAGAFAIARRAYNFTEEETIELTKLFGEPIDGQQEHGNR